MYINITKKHILIFSILVGAIVTYIISGNAKTDADLQESIATKVIRFHVLANSDSDEDQKLKLMVKDAVVGFLEPLMAESASLDESKKILADNSEKITTIAENVISEQGYDYTVNAYFCEDFFPTKSYGDVTFPAGEYTAYRIEIGQHEGKNWWCILYPPLCFVDATYGVLPDDSKSMLKNVLDEEEFSLITENVESEDIKYKFKFLEMLD